MNNLKLKNIDEMQVTRNFTADDEATDELVNCTDNELEKGDLVLIKPFSLHPIDNQNMHWNTMVFNLNILNSAVTDGCLIKYFAPLLNNEHQLPLIIKENYMENISIKDMCSICNFSEYHFMRFFKKYIGMTCIEYINTYRLQIASKFLDTTDKSIMDISFEVGFNNVFRF